MLGGVTIIWSHERGGRVPGTGNINESTIRDDLVKENKRLTVILLTVDGGSLRVGRDMRKREERFG